MADTVVHLEADRVEVDDQPRYRLYASCIDQGDLQDAFMFLTEIVDQEIPGNDVFERVLNVTDLDIDIGFPNNRDTAIAEGKNFYRANEFTKYYDDVEVAANAKQVLQDEVNRYVNEYVTYTTDFETPIGPPPGEDVLFPTSEEAIADSLKTAYDTTLAAYDTAQTTQQAAAVAFTEAEDEETEVSLTVDKRDNLQDDLNDRSSEMGAAQDLYLTFLGQDEPRARWFYNQVLDYINHSGAATGTYLDALTNDAQTFLEAISTATSADVNGTIQTGRSNHTNMAGNPDQYYEFDGASLDNYLITKQNAVTTAQTAKVIADADVTAKYELVEAAYSAAKAVCPDWTPDTPLPPRPST